ncbi:MAG TPA: nitroreductase [Kofleriaceae bacterium]
MKPLDQALEARASVRGFRPEPLDEAEVRRLFAIAQRAPSWCNTQPWRVWVTAPPVTGELAAALQKAATSGLPAPEIAFPGEYPEPYLAHRRACGFALYEAMGIARDDKSRRYDAWLRNYALFDAPHVAVVAQDRRLGQYGTLDVGVWLGILLAAAASFGIDTCPMASVAAYPAPLRSALGIPPEQVVLFGVAFGRADPAVAANQCRTTREPLDANLTLLGFGKS